MIPGERFRIHERIRAYVYEVTNSPKGLQIKLPHTHRNFLRRLLENEVPEIYHGIVEIRSIAREPVSVPKWLFQLPSKALTRWVPVSGSGEYAFKLLSMSCMVKNRRD